MFILKKPEPEKNFIEKKRHVSFFFLEKKRIKKNFFSKAKEKKGLKKMIFFKPFFSLEVGSIKRS
jgi:hypothetical protein